MFSKNKFYLGIAFLVQSAVFLVTFFAVRRANRGIAGFILALSAAGAVAGAVLLYLDQKEEIRWRKLIEDPELYHTEDCDELFADENYEEE